MRKKSRLYCTIECLCVILLSAVLIGCAANDTGNNGASNNNSNNTSNNNDASNDPKIMSINMPSGWKQEGSQILGLKYTSADGTTVVTLSSDKYWGDHDVRTFFINDIENQKYFLGQWNPQVTDKSPVQVNGYDALLYEITTSRGDFIQKYFISVGSYAYYIKIATTLDDWGSVEKDISNILGSYSLK